LVAQYSFYKSFFFCCIQIGYGFLSCFSGSTLFNSFCVTAYNALLFFPIVTFVLDKDVPLEVALKEPKVYRQSAKSWNFTPSTFAWWLLRGVYQATVVLLVTVKTRSVSWHLPVYGHPSEYDGLGIVAFCAFLWIQSVTMQFELRSICWWNVGFIWGFHIFAFVLLLGTSLMKYEWISDLNPYYSVVMTFQDIDFWLSNLVMLGMAVIPIIFYQSYRRTYDPTLAERVSSAHKDLTVSQSSLRLNREPFDDLPTTDLHKINRKKDAHKKTSL